MGVVVIFYLLCCEIISEQKEEVPNQFLKGGRKQSREVEMPQMVNTRDGWKWFDMDFRSFLHARCRRSSNMNDAEAKFLRVGQM